MTCPHCGLAFDKFTSVLGRRAGKKAERCPACDYKLVKKQPVRPPKTYCVDCSRVCRRGSLRCLGCADRERKRRQKKITPRSKNQPNPAHQPETAYEGRRGSVPRGQYQFSNEYAEELRKTGRAWELGD